MIKKLLLLLLILIGYIFLMGDLAEHDEDLKIEKSCVPSKIFAPFFNNFKFIFFFTCHALYLSSYKSPCLLIIKYS